MLNKNDQQVIRQIVAEELQRALNNNWALIGDAITGIVEKAVQRSLGGGTANGVDGHSAATAGFAGLDGGSEKPPPAIVTRQPIRLQTRQSWISTPSPPRRPH